MGLLFPWPRFAGITKQPPQSVWLRGSMVKLPASACQWIATPFCQPGVWLIGFSLQVSEHHRTKKNSDNQSTGYNTGRLLPRWPVERKWEFWCGLSNEQAHECTLWIFLSLWWTSLITCVLWMIWCFLFYSVYPGFYRTAVAVTPWSAVGCLGCRLPGRRWRRPETSCGETVLRLQDSSSPSPLPCNSEELLRRKRNVKRF